MPDWNSRQERKHTCIHHLQTHVVLVHTRMCVHANTGVLVALDRLHSEYSKVQSLHIIFTWDIVKKIAKSLTGIW